METTIQTTRKKAARYKVVRRRDSWQLYLMLLPAVVLTLIFIYVPMGGIVMAFV